jgi:hypothetical protein
MSKKMYNPNPKPNAHLSTALEGSDLNVIAGIRHSQDRVQITYSILANPRSKGLIDCPGDQKRINLFAGSNKTTSHCHQKINTSYLA